MDAKKQDFRIEFYVAKCGAFPVVGEYHDKIASFEEAIALYERFQKKEWMRAKHLVLTFIRRVRNMVEDMSSLAGNLFIWPNFK